MVQELARETFDWSQLGFSAVGKVSSEEEYCAALGISAEK
jgi:hypothetical protein